MNENLTLKDENDDLREKLKEMKAENKSLKDKIAELQNMSQIHETRLKKTEL